MTVTFFDLPGEVRREVYSYVFAGSSSILALTAKTGISPVTAEIIASLGQGSTQSLRFFSKGHLEFLRVSKKCYRDSIETYHETRLVRIRNLDKGNIHELSAIDSIHNAARTIFLEGLNVTDFSGLPPFQKLQDLTLEDINVWGGNRTIEKGQSAVDVFSDEHMLDSLLEHPKYQSLDIVDGHSRHFSDACIKINFMIGYSVFDKNIMRGVQDWYWNCVYTVKTGRLEKKISHRLALW